MIVSNKRVTYGFCPLLSDLECFHRKLLRFLVEKSSFRRNIGTASSSIVIFPRRSECTFGGSVPHLSCPLLFCALRIRSDLAVFAAITLSRNGPQRGGDWRVMAYLLRSTAGALGTYNRPLVSFDPIQVLTKKFI